MADNGSVVIFGVGRGLGAALARRFAAGGHPVALVARKADIIEELARDVGGRAYVADGSDVAATDKLYDAVERDLGPLGCAICNLSHRVQKPFVDLTAAEFERVIRINGMAAFAIAQGAAKRMLPRGEGSIFFTGGRSSTKSVATLAAFGFAKAGARNLAGVLHRELGPQGIHVAHFNIDGGIDNERTRERDPHRVGNDGLVAPDAIAELYFQTHRQPRNCWSLEVERRPWIETA